MLFINVNMRTHLSAKVLVVIRRGDILKKSNSLYFLYEKRLFYSENNAVPLLK